MKEFNLSDLFCELLSGILAIFICLLILDFAGYLCIKAMLYNLKIDFTILTAIIILSYFVGLIVDAIGLALGELIIDKIAATERKPSRKESKKYFNKVQESIATYRYRQWKFYSLYRNIFYLIIIGFYFYIKITWREISPTFSIITGIIIFIIEITIFYSMRTLIDLYYKITKHID